MGEITDLIQERGITKSKLTRSLTAINTFKSGDDINQIISRKAVIEQIFRDFEQIQLKIEKIETAPESREGHEQERVLFENKYHEVAGKIHGILNPRKDANNITDASRSSDAINATNTKYAYAEPTRIHLPTLNLKPFSGSYKDWLSFYNSFTTVIDDENNKLSNCQKLQYLKSCLRDEALRAVEPLTLSDENYATAWEILERRFRNTRLIVYDHIHAIVNAPLIAKPIHLNIRSFIDTINSNIASLKLLDVPIDTWDALVTYLIEEKLDFATNREWQSTLNTDVPKLKHLIEFLEKRCQLLESLNKLNSKTAASTSSFSNNKFQRKLVSHVSLTNTQCPICKNQAHTLYQCTEFLNLAVDDRIAKVKQAKLCENCCRNNHASNNCFSKTRCRKCNLKHHTLLHKETTSNRENAHTIANHSCHNSEKTVLLSTAIVLVKDKYNKFHPCRVLLDPGSMSSYISTNLCDKLKLQRSPVNIRVGGIGSLQTAVKHSTNLHFKAKFGGYSENLHCLVLDKITDNLPLQTINVGKLEIPSNIKLSDPKFYESKPIDLLIGAQLYLNILQNGSVTVNQLTFQNTQLGWIVGGMADCSHKIAKQTTSMLSTLDAQVERFWQLERCNEITKRKYVGEEAECKNNFVRTTTRRPDGHFVIKLPFKTNPPNLGFSKEIAVRQFYNLERKFLNDPSYKDDYVKFMREFISLGHMIERPYTQSNNTHAYYLPHHAVTKESTTTKLRVVFNASQINLNKINPPEKRTVSMLSRVKSTEWSLLTRFSSFQKTQRVMAWITRFISNTKKQDGHIRGPLTVEELNHATKRLVFLIQKREFEHEFKQLSENRPIDKRSNLLSLNIFLDENKIIRVGGRLKNSSLSPDVKHPMLLPKHHLTNLIIEHIHKDQLHAGVQGTITALRQTFWLTSARNNVRRMVHKCFTCSRAKPKALVPIMGNLPAARTHQNRPFLTCGVDYAGPMLIKESRGRGKRLTKAYVAVFVCFSTKAVHLELVSDLTSQSFLNALKRLTSRRGHVRHIHSDNATNFVGANNELIELRRFTESDSFKNVITKLANDGITWHFLPPASPHMGGIWEINIKRVKHHLRRTLGEAHLTFEELYTLLTRVEAIINSRPITPLSTDPNDLAALTPAHFLIGEPLINNFVETDITTAPENRLSRWQRIERVRQHFWNRWAKEYLTQHLNRSQGRTAGSHEPINIGALVVLVDENTPPQQWRMGRIVQLHPGNDGILRVVSIKTIRGVVKRALRKVCVLANNE